MIPAMGASARDVVMASLIPVMWSTGVGADIMQPIAAPILGGMVTRGFWNEDMDNVAP